MSSSLVADLKLISGKDVTLLKSVNFKTLVIGVTPQVIKIENINNDKTESTKRDVWEFCLNNKSMFENVSVLEFDKRIHEHVAIKYFYNMLEENGIRFGMSNHEYASFTLADYALSSRGEDSELSDPTFYKWMSNKK